MCTSCCKLYLLCESAKYINLLERERNFITLVSARYPRYTQEFLSSTLIWASHRTDVLLRTLLTPFRCFITRGSFQKKKKKKGGEERKREKNCRKQKKKADGFFFFLQEVKLKILFRPSLLSETGSCLIIEKNEGGKGC